MKCATVLCMLFVVGSAIHASASSYQKTDGTVVDPIRIHTSYDPAGIPSSYSGPNLEPGVVSVGASVGSTDLDEADLENANLAGANFFEAFLIGADLRSAILTAADFRYAHLQGSDMGGAVLDGASLSFVDGLTDVNLNGASLQGAEIWFSYLDGTTLVGADLCGASLAYSQMTSVNLSLADFRGADLTGALFLSTTIHPLGPPVYDGATNFAETGFDPVAAGWRLAAAVPALDGIGVMVLVGCLALTGFRSTRCKFD